MCYPTWEYYSRFYYAIIPDVDRADTDYISFATEQRVTASDLPDDAIILIVEHYTMPDGGELLGEEAIIANIQDVKRDHGWIDAV